MITRSTVLFAAVVALLFGAAMCPKVYVIIRTMNAPIVTGDVMARVPTTFWSVPRAEFAIRVQGTSDEVRAHTGRYCLKSVGQTVQFRYSAGPNREVFLFDHEENPIWILLFCWGSAALFILMLSPWKRLDSMRRSLGWH